MLRFVFSAMALAGILATTLPAFADPLPATASDHAQAAAAATPQPTPPARDGHDADIIPVGPGWG